MAKKAKTHGDSGANLVPRIRTNSVCAPVNYSKLIFGVSQLEDTLHPQNPPALAPEAGKDITSAGSQDNWQSLDPFTPPKSRKLQEAKPVLGALLTYEGDVENSEKPTLAALLMTGRSGLLGLSVQPQ